MTVACNNDTILLYVLCMQGTRGCLRLTMFIVTLGSLRKIK